MTRPYSVAFNQKMVQRLTGRNAVSALHLSRETGVRQQNFLVDRDKKGIISSSLADRLVEEDIALSSLIDDEWAIYVEQKASTHSKMDGANRINELENEQFEHAVVEHLILFDGVLEYLVDND